MKNVFYGSPDVILGGWGNHSLLSLYCRWCSFRSHRSLLWSSCRAVVIKKMLLSFRIRPHLLQNVSSWKLSQYIVSVFLHSGHTVCMCLQLFMCGHIHIIVQTFRKCVVLFFRFRFVLFHVLGLCRGLGGGLWFVCRFLCGLFCFCFCGSICRPSLFFVFGVLLCCIPVNSIFVCYGVWCRFFRRLGILLWGI